jgi:hypothetical protein
MMKKLVALPILFLAYISGRYDKEPEQIRLPELEETQCPDYPKAIKWDGGTAWATQTSDKLYKTSGFFSARLSQRGEYESVYQSDTAKVVRVKSKETETFLWSGQPLSSLTDRHLYNIIKAVRSGFWRDGRPVAFSEKARKNLLKEWWTRNVETPENIYQWEKLNDRW